MKRIELDNGKYTIVYDETDSYPEKILRYGVPWKDGDNVIFCLCDELEQVKLERDDAINYIRELARDNGYCCGCAYFKDSNVGEVCTYFGADEDDGYCARWKWCSEVRAINGGNAND